MEYTYPIFKEGFTLKQKLGVGGFRGFVTNDGEVIGWPIVDGDHNEFLALNHKRDEDFATRWRQYQAGHAAEIDSGNPQHKALVEDWLDEAYANAG